jgi:putative transposase
MFIRILLNTGGFQFANSYPWCSAAWFERSARPAQVKSIYGFKIDRLNIYDDYDVVTEW